MKLQGVEWGRFKLIDLFFVKRGKRLTVEKRIKGTRPLVTAGYENAGVAQYIGNREQEIFPKNTITIDMFANSFFRNYCYSADDNILILHDKNKISSSAKIFIVGLINKTLQNKFDYGRQFRMGSLNHTEISLPTKNGKIDFDFMENFIADLEAKKITELESYFLVTGLNDFTLKEEEKQVLNDFKESKIEFGEFAYKSIFNNITQGRRLKKDDQIPGKIPFVMAGIKNTGVVNYISNPVAQFPKNAITIDIFGNTFYRDFDFGAGDDTGVYWNDEQYYSKEVMLFFATSMGKSIKGKFDFGKKLRSSQSLNFKMQLPIENKKPNFKTIEIFISAIQKLVIKDVVLYVDQKLKGKKVANSN